MPQFTVDTGNAYITSVSVFPVDPDRQGELVKILTEAAHDLARH